MEIQGYSRFIKIQNEPVHSLLKPSSSYLRPGWHPLHQSLQLETLSNCFFFLHNYTLRKLSCTCRTLSKQVLRLVCFTLQSISITYSTNSELFSYANNVLHCLAFAHTRPASGLSTLQWPSHHCCSLVLGGDPCSRHAFSILGSLHHFLRLQMNTLILYIKVIFITFTSVSQLCFK